MGSEERIARRILADAFQHYARGPLSSAREAELRDLIAAALREAEEAEREACAVLAENECSYEAPTYAEIEAGRSIAAAIRARSTS